jgi:tetratricopeptide (TPR) repeat protein
MKKIITMIAFISLFSLSCSKNFIDIAPVSTVSVNAVYKTDKDFQDAVVGSYSVLRNQYQSFWMFGDLRGDDSWKEVSKNLSSYYVDVFIIDANDALLKNTWINYYNLIAGANTVLSKIADADSTVIVNKNRHIGEAKFLRALAYFDLVRIFGDVPEVTTPITIEEGYKAGRTAVDKIYNEIIIPDLLDAQNRLPRKYTGTDVGRATQGAAKTLLGKVYLTRKDFANAETKLQEVTTMGYSLLPNYNDLFDYTKDEHHSEYIFDVEYQDNLGGLGSSYTNAFLPLSAPLLTFYGIAGQGGEENNPTQALLTAFEPNDKRKAVTVDGSGGFIDGSGSFVKFLQCHTITKKYITTEAVASDSKVNWKILRYADVLLMYAEALNENGKTDPALGYLNQVRARAGLPAYSGLGQSDTREMIYKERRVELGMEGHRWFDLLRTGRAYDSLQASGMKPYMTVFPVPLSQIQLVNDPALFPQNEGYN